MADIVSGGPIAWLDTLIGCPDDETRCEVLRAGSIALPESAITVIQNEVLGCIYSNPNRASELAGCARAVAAVAGDARVVALASRVCANVAYTQGQHEKAAELYREAIRGFEALQDDVELGRTYSSGLQTLIYLGRYDEASDWADRAEAIFLRHGDTLRLARLDTNVGNLHFRRDQHRAAIARYERALAGFGEAAQPNDAGAVLSNLASCHTALGQFGLALECYQRAREHCLRHNLGRLVAQADYNIAWLWYLRGEYREARRLYAQAREDAEAAGDSYHLALCDLDEADLYLELNLTREGFLLARRSAEAFLSLGMRYERAKALVNQAVAESQSGDARAADATLRAARSLFVAEGNQVWAALIDLLRAVIAFHDNREQAAKRLATAAWKILSKVTMPGKAAQCLILLARISLRDGHPTRAHAVCREALERLGDGAVPSLRFHAHLVIAECAERQGQWQKAWEHCESARAQIEHMRGRVDTEDLQISVLKDKLTVYEMMVSLCLDSQLGTKPDSEQNAILLMQEAKSRSLSERLAATESASDDAEDQRQIEVRQELNVLHRQMELAVLRNAAPGTVDELKSRCAELEAELMILSQRAGQIEVSEAGITGFAALQAMVPRGIAVLEYFEARSRLWVGVLTAEGCRIVPLGPSAAIWQECRLLRFQLGKCAIHRGMPAGSAMVDSAAPLNHHLSELYRMLIDPCTRELDASISHLVVAPHRGLHAVPFSALLDGKTGASLIDRFTLSVAPSARAWASCQLQPQLDTSATLVVSVPDPAAPAIEAEADAVCRMFPHAVHVRGEQATASSLANGCTQGLNLLHLGTHGMFRRDNPLFSSLKLADGPLRLIDLRQYRLAVNLVTLAGCHTGASVSIGADEILGLMRGFLLAGARSLLVALWEIDDRSSAEFMQMFYTRLRNGEPAALALAEATKQLRADHAHPWYWAPYTLVGAVC